MSQTQEPTDLLYTNAAQFERLRLLITNGESQSVEFKQQMPENTTDLAKEIAAFATSNSGTIIIGVDDDGNVVGLQDSTTLGRKTLTARIEGICREGVKPSITPKISFADLDGKVLAVLEIIKGSQPIYYVSNIPYLRHNTSACKANPQEVIDLIIHWHEGEKLSPETEFLIHLAAQLSDVVAAVNILDNGINNDIHDLQNEWHYLSETLHPYFQGCPPIFNNLKPAILKISDDLSHAAHQTLTMGSGWNEMKSFAENAKSAATAMLVTILENQEVEAIITATNQTSLIKIASDLVLLSERLDQMDTQGRFQEIQEKASAIGRKLAEVSNYNKLQNCLELQALAIKLLQVGSARTYMDGGASHRRVLDGIRELNSELQLYVTNS